METIEYETSVRLPISQAIFDLMIEKFSKDKFEKSLILHYNDTVFPNSDSNLYPSYRLANNAFQLKQCIHRLNLLKVIVCNQDNKESLKNDIDIGSENLITNAMFIPFTRTTAKETIAEASDKFSTVQDIIIRYTLYSENNIRVCVEKISQNQGGAYYFSAEIEYDRDYKTINYEEFTKIENSFWNLLSDKYLPEFYHLLDTNAIYNYVELSQLLNIPCRKFSPIHQYSCNLIDYKLKYKFDGYKGRMINNNLNTDTILYWDDMHNTGEISSKFLNRFPHIIFQYEVIPDKRWIIFTDIIGVIFHKQLYMPEPNDVLSFFSSFPRQEINHPLLSDKTNCRSFKFIISINDNRNNNDDDGLLKDEFSIGVQFTIRDKENEDYFSSSFIDYTDGFIIVCNNREYKYKIPTLDVRIINEMAFLDESATPIFEKKLVASFLLNPQSIYEITLRRGQVVILRERFERQFTSNSEEFEIFKSELEYMSQQLRLLQQ
ncbi:uncharacterized protein LOC130677881 [Microplitis mediator]|uniref:uncharacterized protein LOC130677881 n=1 Tax=Microplitis mediator TaxID=375433 RepID=UPI0025574C63|nr:uncharacterized protein LOC130677881 [Microplitis mediator]